MSFLTIFLAVLLANALTISCIAGWFIYRNHRRMKNIRAQQKIFQEAFERGLEGFHRLMDDINNDKNEVRH